MIDIVDLALQEDIGSGDVTVRHFTDPAMRCHARIIAKQAGVLAGVITATDVFHRVDKSIVATKVLEDGAFMSNGDEVMRIAGPTGSILTAERTVLNFLMRLSGVATQTRRYVDRLAGTGVHLLDTRKTTPGFRELEKAAVRAGGGTNHRLGLHDMVMVKDNHLAGGLNAASLAAGVRAARAAGLRVEVEADNLEQVREFSRVDGIDVILLDNMSMEDLRAAVLLRPAGIQLEASGGITLENIGEVAGTGVNFISVGALTHSATALDLSLEILGDE